MKLLKTLNKAKYGLVATALSATTTPSYANLPGAPSTDSSSGKSGYTGQFTDYIMDGAILLLLVMAFVGLIIVGKNIMSTYSEISDGKAQYKDLGVSVVVGIVILSGFIYLLTEAADVLGLSI